MASHPRVGGRTTRSLHTSVSLRVEDDGVGSAAFGWTDVVDAITDRLVDRVAEALHANARLLGLRFVDANGHDTDGPSPGGTVLVGFATSRPPIGDRYR